MRRRIGGVAVVAAAGLVALLAPRTEAGNRWMMERMADDLHRQSEQVARRVALPARGHVALEAAVQLRPDGTALARAARVSTAGVPGSRRLPLEAAGTPVYQSTIREATLDIPVVGVK